MTKNVLCKICRKRAQFLFSGTALHKYTAKYYKCMECDFLFIENHHWLDEAYGDAIANLDVGVVQRNINFSSIVPDIIEGYFDKGRKFLDFAGGYGLFVRMMRDKGLDFYRQDRYCQNIFAKRFDIKDLEPGNREFELITAFEVFEHMENPMEQISKLFTMTDTIVFSTEIQPSDNIKSVDDWWYFIPETGQHISFFSEKSLNILAYNIGGVFYTDGIIHMITKKKFSENPLTKKEKFIPVKSLIEHDMDIYRNHIDDDKSYDNDCGSCRAIMKDVAILHEESKRDRTMLLSINHEVHYLRRKPVRYIISRSIRTFIGKVGTIVRHEFDKLLDGRERHALKRRGKESVIYVDCSFVFHSPDINTGIQRVVRNIVRNARYAEKKFDVKIVPVVIYGNKLFYADIDDVRITFIASKIIQKKFSGSVDRVWSNIIMLLYVWRNIVTVKKDDKILFIDSSWSLNWEKIADKARSLGVMSIGVIYDLIPIRYPKFCDDGLVTIFRKFAKDSVRRMDGFIAISQTVMRDMEDFVAEQGIAKDAKRFSYFHLGSDFGGGKVNQGNVRQKVRAIFRDGKPVFIIVSTVEPRKNHKYLLDAFTIAWKSGSEAKLFIIGRIGWKVDELIEDIENHKEYGKKLFMMHDISDIELDFAYKNAKSLVFPSIVEGFGLPIVEGLHRNLPVMASDTPIHREVGGDNIVYFDLADPRNLTKMIIDIEHGKDILKGPPDKITAYSWQESTIQLFREVLKMSNKGL